MTDHYKILGIERFATPEEVKKAYFVMAKKYHPDSGDDTEVQKFHEVAEAYKILSDPDSRKVYDISLGVIEEGKNDIQEESEFKVVRSSKREAYRDVELKEFHRNRFKSAVWRVIGFTAFIAMIAYIVALVLLGTALLGLIAGLAIGFSLSVNKNFNLSSYFESDRAHRTFRIFTWALLFLGLGYFVWLVLKSVFN